MSRARFDEEPEDRHEEAAMWCMRLAEDRLTPDELRSFDIWLATDGNSEALDEAVLVWQVAEAVARRPQLIGARTDALESFRKGNGRRWMRNVKRRRYWWMGLAAALMLMVLTSVMVLRDRPQLYETNVGERRIAMLQDGSRLSLDASTEVEVRMADNRRQLTLLSGRAKFDVAKDPQRPFSVMAGNKLIVATGTSFSVELLRGQVHVLLYEGHVEVLDQRDDDARPTQLRLRDSREFADAALIPGRELVVPLVATQATLVKPDLPQSLSWEAGQLSFDNEPLSSAIERANRYASEPLAIGDPELASIRVNGIFDAGDTDAFVEGVVAFNRVRVVREAGKITFRRR